jgi:hypothetical protein
VKLPGTLEGRSPYDAQLVQDAQSKADDAGAQYFFTWNVNTFVLWDRYRQDVPLLERRVREWQAGRYFRNAVEVGRSATRIECSSRSEAELVYRLATLGLRGTVQILTTELGCRTRLARIPADILTDERSSWTASRALIETYHPL